ncbi:MAG: cardiolipin synthase [Clostridia bacterium]|nr:cardiolipin synthase [Clostridia bacterium]
MFSKLFKLFRRFIQALFSRFVLTTLFIIAQIVGIWLAFEFLGEKFWVAHIVTVIVGVFLVLIIINKDEVAEYKLPWLLATAVFPALGFVLFVFFGSNQPGYRMKKRYRAVYARAKEYLSVDHAVAEKLQQTDGEAYAQARYLYNAASAAVYTDTETQYFPMGEDMFPVFLEELKKAKRFIFMEYFIVQEGKFWDSVLDILEEKAKAGVEVRFMYDDVGSIGKVRMNYVKKIRARGVQAQVFRSFLPFISTMHNNRDHRKITVIDNAVAFTGGLNLADEYINIDSRFGVWKDNTVMFKGPAVTAATALFLTLWDVQARKESDYEKYLALPEEYKKEGTHAREEEGNEQGYVTFFGDGPRPLYEQQVGKNVYLNILGSATKYVYITSPYLVCDNEILSAIRLAAQRGVDVRLITPKIPDKKLIYLVTKANYSPLINAGVKIYEYTPGFIHAKTFVSDDKFATVTTINLDYRSLVHHFECGMWMYNTPTVAKVKEDLLNTIAQSEEITVKAAKLNPMQLFLRSLVQLLTPLL